MTALVAVIHAGLAAAWLGWMAYSLFVIQPKLARFYARDDESREALTVMIASGNRWKVLGLIAVIGASGIVLWLLTSAPLWIVLAKTVLLVVATGIFWYVSWRHWPRRVFATTAERPLLQRRLRMLATTMLALAGTAFVLGVVSTYS